ncbi:MAG TPA: hypothetical protein VKE42_12765 [Candidatus Cybelea sp.]|nr:hypothetical protein [Candidatus Cybelea sp.]
MDHIRKMMLSRGHGKPQNVECMIELAIDLDGIAAELGQKALRNKTQKARAMRNKIIARVRVITGQQS